MPKEVIVVLQAPDFGLAPAAFDSASPLAEILSQFGASLEPVFERPTSAPAGLGVSAPAMEQDELSRYFRASVDEGTAEALAERLRGLGQVETVYIKPAVENPLAPGRNGSLEAAMASPAPASGPIPNFRQSQGYLDPAPGGVDAAAAWALPGGRGASVRIIDIEGGWQFSHLDLRGNQGGLVGGTAINDLGWRNHGTAVLGEISGDDNGSGVVGIAPDAVIMAISHTPSGSARAIQLAAARLRAGDIMLLEMHRPGPRHAFQARDDQGGYIAIEWWPDDFLAITSAVRKGIIVVEAAGNGSQDLDDPLYDTPAAGFPSSWRNPFRQSIDSGAILVGAGAPPSGQFGPDRSRLDFSNFGQRVDCQGWGRGVVTTGYGDLFRGESEDGWFTATFSGTSSASPIVVGALACIQGLARERGRVIEPDQARNLLRTTGSPQVASGLAPLSQRIGNRPDISALISRLALVA